MSKISKNTKYPYTTRTGACFRGAFIRTVTCNKNYQDKDNREDNKEEVISELTPVDKEKLDNIKVNITNFMTRNNNVSFSDITFADIVWAHDGSPDALINFKYMFPERTGVSYDTLSTVFTSVDTKKSKLDNIIHPIVVMCSADTIRDIFEDDLLKPVNGSLTMGDFDIDYGYMLAKHCTGDHSIFCDINKMPEAHLWHNM